MGRATAWRCARALACIAGCIGGIGSVACDAEPAAKPKPPKASAAEGDQPAPRPTSAPRPPAASAAQTEHETEQQDDPARAPQQPLPEQAALELISKLTQLQERRKLEPYAALYDESFFGLVRRPDGERRFDRDGWLAERKRLFKRRAKLELTRVHAATTGEIAVVSFEQTTTVRGLSGRGRIVAATTDDGLKIVAETLSVPQRGRSLHRAHRARNPPRKLMLAVHEGGTHLVISSQAEQIATRGDPVVAKSGNPLTLTHAIDASALPDAVRALKGLEVQLYSAGGLACRGTLGSPLLMRRVVLHPRLAGELLGRPDALEQAARKPLSPPRIAQAGWRVSGGAGWLVAPVEQAQGDCSSALWGRSSELKLPRVYSGTPIGSAASERVEDKLAALSTYRKARRALERAAPELRTFRGHKRAFHSYAASAPGSCLRPTRSLFALFEEMGEDLWLLTDGGLAEGVQPLALLDADGDDLIEIVATPLAPAAAESERRTVLRQRPDKGFDSVDLLAPVILGPDCPR